MLGKQMLRLILTFICVCSLSPLYAKKSSASLPHPTELKQYYDSGHYLQDIVKKAADAQEYIDSQLRYARKGNLAIVLEVDETALSNYAALERMQFTQNGQALASTFMLGQATAIPPILALYQHARDNKIAVFFVSSRPNTPEMIEATVKNLKSAGYQDWQELILMPVEGSAMKIADFKTHTRKHITAQGYEILLNMSAHEPDLLGGYAEIRVKLPNPFYTVG